MQDSVSFLESCKYYATHMSLPQIIILSIQAIINLGIVSITWYDWKKYKNISSVVVLSVSTSALFLCIFSLISQYIDRASSISVTVLLLPLYTWSQWSIYKERVWLAYTA